MAKCTAVHAFDIGAARTIDFDIALEAFLDGGDPEELLLAASAVRGSSIPLGREHAEAVAELTGCNHVLQDYDDAGRAVRLWFSVMGEPGVRH
jgi:hypothetical protein